MSRDEARAYAKAYVRHLLSGSYTVERAKEEIHMGAGARGEPGYAISRGKITCPAFSSHVFSFEEIAQAIQQADTQPELF